MSTNSSDGGCPSIPSPIQAISEELDAALDAAASFIVAGLKAEIDRLTQERDAALSSFSLAEQATRTALESIPIAMTAAAEKEREACAAVADDVAESPSKTPLPVSDDESNDFDVDAFDSGCVRTARRIATAIRNRSEAK